MFLLYSCNNSIDTQSRSIPNVCDKINQPTKFESEETARSQVERLQNQQRSIFWCHGEPTRSVQGAEPGRQHEETLRQAWVVPLQPSRTGK